MRKTISEYHEAYRLSLQRKRIKRIQSQVDPIIADIFKLIVARKLTPQIRKQLDQHLTSVSGYLKNQCRRAGL